MSKNLTLIIFLVIFFIIYNILLLKFLPQKPTKTKEKEKNVETVNIKSLNLKDKGTVELQNENFHLYFSKGGYLKEILFKNYRTHSDSILKILYPNFVSDKDSLIESVRIENGKLYFSSKDGEIQKIFEIKEGYKIKIKTKGLKEFYFSILPFIDKDDNKNFTTVEYTKGRIRKHKLKDFEKVDFAGSETLWFGSEVKYFVSVIIKPDYFNKIIRGESYKEGKFFRMPLNQVDSFYVYIGPKDYFVLKKEGFGLDKIYPLGFSIVKPFTLFILYSFKWSYEKLKHFSIVILIFTLLMKIVFMPLTLKSLRAMKKMEELRPRLEALKKAYKDDPKKLNEETLKLYREMGVNPFSGCLPLLLQLPVFWALYQVLRYDIMFRGAELFLWIRDLSLKDPYYVLPILMGLTSLLQQFLQPSQDPQTKRIGFFMSAFITIIFLNFPAGLVYYWLLYNIFGLFETLLIKRRIHK